MSACTIISLFAAFLAVFAILYNDGIFSSTHKPITNADLSEIALRRHRRNQRPKVGETWDFISGDAKQEYKTMHYVNARIIRDYYDKGFTPSSLDSYGNAFKGNNGVIMLDEVHLFHKIKDAS